MLSAFVEALDPTALDSPTVRFDLVEALSFPARGNEQAFASRARLHGLRGHLQHCHLDHRLDHCVGRVEP